MRITLILCFTLFCFSYDKGKEVVPEKILQGVYVGNSTIYAEELLTIYDYEGEVVDYESY